jgi:hypothetical protein
MSLIDVLKELEPQIGLLNKTDDFVAYVTDSSYENELKHALATIPEELYNRVFINQETYL